MSDQLLLKNWNEVEDIPIQDGILRLYPHLFLPAERENCLTQLKEGVK